MTYVLTPFGGEAAAVAADPMMASNKVAMLTKHAGDQPWSGTTVSIAAAPAMSIPTLPMTATRTKASVKVYLPSANVPVRLKVEDANDPTHSVETQVNSGAASTWQTLQFDFSMQATGTAALNPSYTFNKISVFVDFNNVETADKIFYIDDVVFY